MIDAEIDEGSSLGRELAVAQELALRAAEVLARHREGGVVRRAKQGGELVTAADLEADAIICGGLARAFPHDALLSEEAPDGPGRLTAPRVWIVDPIDGTRDFVDGGDEHVVSIGLAVRGRAVLGVVYNPARREMFAGVVGGGVALDGAPVRASAARTLAGARLTVSRTEWRHALDDGACALPVRAISSAAYKLARVAAGLDDGTFSIWPRREWDVCAGVALVVAGGGRVATVHGERVTFNRRDVLLPGGLVAAGPALHGPLLRHVERCCAASLP